MKDKIKVLNRKGIQECYDMKPRIFNTWLIDELGIPGTRAKKLGQAVDQLHDAICYMSPDYQKRILGIPLADLLNKFGDLEDLRQDFKQTLNTHINEDRVLFSTKG